MLLGDEGTTISFLKNSAEQLKSELVINILSNQYPSCNAVVTTKSRGKISQVEENLYSQFLSSLEDLKSI